MVVLRERERERRRVRVRKKWGFIIMRRLHFDTYLGLGWLHLWHARSWLDWIHGLSLRIYLLFSSLHSAVAIACELEHSNAEGIRVDRKMDMDIWVLVLDIWR